MDETTTDADVQEQAQATAQPEEQHAEAEQTVDSEPQATNQDGTEPAESAEGEQPAEQPADTSEDDLGDWAAKKGIDLSTPEGQAKALKSWREAEKTMHNKAQEASELSKQLNEQPPVEVSQDPMVQEALNRAARAERSVSIREWREARGVTTEQDRAMAAFVQANPEKGHLLSMGYLTLDDLFKISGAGEADPEALKAQGKQEALQSIANKQRTTAVSGKAVATGVPEGLNKQTVGTWWDSLGTEGRQNPENRAKLDRILSS